MLHSVRKMFVGSRDEGCQFALDITEVKTPNSEETPPAGKGDFCISSYRARRAGIRQGLVFGTRQAGSEDDGKLAAQGQMETSYQQDGQTSKRTQIHVSKHVNTYPLSKGSEEAEHGLYKFWKLQKSARL